MGRAPCCDKENVKRGPWSPEEDDTLRNYVQTYGTGGNWISLPQRAGLRRCGKSCRLRWLNYLRPDIKHGGFTQEEDEIICSLYNQIGSKWSLIASQLPGRTDNDVKNYWNTKLKKKVLAGKSSFTNITTTTSINNIDGSVPAINNPNSLHHQAPPTTSKSQPCLPKDEITYNLDYSSSFLPILSDVGNYGFYVSLPSDPLLMQYSRPEAMFTDPTMEITTTTAATTTHVANSSQEGSVISDSTETKSVSMHGNGYADDTGNILMDPFGLYDHDHFPYEVFNGIWGQEKLAAQLVVPSCYDTLADHDISQADIKPPRHV